MSQRLSNIKDTLTPSQASRLQQARSSTTLSAQELKDVIFGQGYFNRFVQPTINYIQQNQHIFSQPNIQEHSLCQQRKEGARMVMALRKYWKIDLEHEPLEFCMISYAIAMYNGAMSTKSLLHYMLYAKSLLLYGSNKMHVELYKKALTGEDIGCFCLTEFHHGSFSKGIKTLAVYDPKTDQFVLTTQGTKGMKFWIGGLSEISNKVILWAQLYINGKSEGPHPFFLPIRCPKTHKVLNGITIGDCGPKKGLNAIDNGYMILQNVRIPREYLLGKYGSVDSQGNYSSIIKSWDMRFGMHMSALSSGRAIIAFTINIFNALTIALRYSHSRKQFDTPDKKDEIIIIDYALTKMRLVPEISKMVLHLMAGKQLAAIYCEKGLFEDEEKVTQMHAISAAVKARYTWAALKGCEQSRTVLGGHGYSSLSRIPSIVDDIEVNVTWEGDNNVLLQQASKYLMRTISKKLKTKVIDLSFVHQKVEIDLDALEDSMRSMDSVELLLQDLLRVRYFSAEQVMKNLAGTYKDKQQVDMHFHPLAGNALSLAFADYWTFSIAKDRISKAKSSEMKQYLSDCLYLWSFGLLEKERYGSHGFRAALQKEIVALSAQLVNRSVIATDALTLPSQLVGSPFADPNGEGFKEYTSLLFTRKDAFTKAKHYETILKETKLS